MRARLALAARWYIGLVFLGSGVALLATILFGAPLLLALTIAVLAGAVALAVYAATAPPLVRDRFARLAVAGLFAGVLATVAYDISKAILSYADPSPYNPFEAVRIFGVLLVGPDAAPVLTWACGAAFHLFNGVTFAIAYAQFFGAIAARSSRWALATGMLWGLWLETFQLALFPGWLSIGFVAEFATISFAAHLVYGATLATVVRRRTLRAIRGADGRSEA